MGAINQGTAKLAKLHYPVGEYFFGDRGPRVSGGQALSFTPPEAPAAAPALIPPSRTTTITYSYDPLYRLTAADYDNGNFYHYTYDATGNRLTQEMEAVTNNYVYDDANRLTSVDGQAYTYDINGNLLSDGTNTYTYNLANRLTSVTQGGISYNFVYNGLGDRLQQTVDTVTTIYTLDINTRLTQVLTDGTDTYLYGLGRIGEFDGTDWTYPLADALGSVRQLVDASGAPVMAQNYAPYGDVLESYGAESSNYGFAGEWTDGTGLQYLRARYLNTGIGRFISRDTWGGDYRRPLSLNRWGYVEGNPVNRVDPSGYGPCEGPYGDCQVDDYYFSQLADFDSGDKIHKTGGKIVYFKAREKVLIDEALNDIARAYARAYSVRELILIENSGCIGWDPDVYSSIDPITAFKQIHGGKIMFKKFSAKTKHWGWGGSKQQVWVMDGGTLERRMGTKENPENTLYAHLYTFNSGVVSDALLEGAFKRFIVHEMAHVFDNDLNRVPREAVTKSLITGKDPYALNGFCGTKHEGWQWRATVDKNEEGEIFADMFIGWVYDCLGKSRADFMNENMPVWVYDKVK